MHFFMQFFSKRDLYWGGGSAFYLIYRTITLIFKTQSVQGLLIRSRAWIEAVTKLAHCCLTWTSNLRAQFLRLPKAQPWKPWKLSTSKIKRYNIIRYASELHWVGSSMTHVHAHTTKLQSELHWVWSREPALSSFYIGMAFTPPIPF